MAQKKVTGWIGWVYFAGFMMMLVGIFQVVAGLVALFREEMYLVGADELLVFNYSEWGWIHLAIGVLLFLSSFSVFRGGSWGIFLGTFLAILSAFAQFAFIAAFPVWSVIVIVVDVFIVYSLLVHGKEARA